jgi:lysozyme family protein
VQPFDALLGHPIVPQLVDDSVLSGPVTAIRALQHVLGVTVDGLLGAETVLATLAAPGPLLNNALVAARCARFSAIVDRDPTQLKWFHGWVRRACLFYL